eukprot:TRINITY_DN66815_c6_g3_i1.p1 TRINITY_DN66815_c6_g3~~TRINITY_DN66815_c6_g3_i1.p1  ORF type:complete len:463 (-),score=292.52 TRINITY_DN66815_c6_g3_i1:107-1495(-)
MHRVDVLIKYKRYKIGRLDSAKGPSAVELHQPGAISQVPYAENNFEQGFKSAYMNEGHRRFRKATREFFERELLPDMPLYNKQGKVPSQKHFQKMGINGILASRIGPGPHMKMLSQMGIKLLGGVKPEEFDYFHEMIAHEESARLGYPGFQDGLGAGLVIGLPPLLHFGSRATVAKYAPAVFRGDKRICLAISEPFAGSDVANIKCTAKKTADGKFYEVSGVKKWITNGVFSDLFVTAVRTGGPGIGGISLLLIERSEGLSTKSIKTSYSPSAGTAYVTYDKVLVPVENLLGKENQGFRCIMYNFNHERWLIVCSVVRGTRQAVEECMRWANQRKVFGKTLLQQPVIRAKLAEMIAQVESVYAWLENITYQMCKMSYREQSLKLAGPIALLKYQSTRVALMVADQAAQIFGGRAITQSGPGHKVESFIRAIKYGAILGGSEEIMSDLAIRQAMKQMPTNARL